MMSEPRSLSASNPSLQTATELVEELAGKLAEQPAKSLALATRVPNSPIHSPRVRAGAIGGPA